MVPVVLLSVAVLCAVVPDAASAGRPCFYSGAMYEDGSRIPDPCNICTCLSGRAICTMRACVKDFDRVFPTEASGPTSEPSVGEP